MSPWPPYVDDFMIQSGRRVEGNQRAVRRKENFSTGNKQTVTWGNIGFGKYWLKVSGTWTSYYSDSELPYFRETLSSKAVHKATRGISGNWNARLHVQKNFSLTMSPHNPSYSAT